MAPTSPSSASPLPFACVVCVSCLEYTRLPAMTARLAAKTVRCGWWLSRVRVQLLYCNSAFVPNPDESVQCIYEVRTLIGANGFWWLPYPSCPSASRLVDVRTSWVVTDCPRSSRDTGFHSVLSSVLQHQWRAGNKLQCDGSVGLDRQHQLCDAADSPQPYEK